MGRYALVVAIPALLSACVIASAIGVEEKRNSDDEAVFPLEQILLFAEQQNPAYATITAGQFVVGQETPEDAGTVWPSGGIAAADRGRGLTAATRSDQPASANQ